ncbi:MAG: nitrite reductase large subunit [Mycobacterium sp.]|jgi:NAD(P)H-nitrite reductase large subunit|nr:nitrite reductase large subunit [Mycobacterium sp.]
MNQQLDEAGAALLRRMIGGLGISVHLDVGTDSIVRLGDDAVRVLLGDGIGEVAAIDGRCYGLVDPGTPAPRWSPTG